MKVTLEQAISLLNGGLVVAIPTETVYGLAASINFPKAIEEIFRLKGRPSNNPLIVHLASANNISLYVKELPKDFSKLAAAFWPGPLTLVLPVIEDTIPEIARAGLPTAAFRVPGHEITHDVLKGTGPLVMPSANISGKPSATSAEHVEHDFGSGFSVLDGGECKKGVESTILCFEQTEWVVVRLGAMPPETFLPVLGYTPKVKEVDGQDAPICPGQLYRHYSPKAKLILSDNISNAKNIVGFSDRTYPKNSRLFSLGRSDDPDTAAQLLYDVLRSLDREHIEEAVVDMNFPKSGLWMTLRERLQKAASP
jgi:L-threonylcarbamoyladenylate synthase